MRSRLATRYVSIVTILELAFCSTVLGQTPKIGTPVNYDFQHEVVGAPGLQSLAGLHGRAALVHKLSLDKAHRKTPAIQVALDLAKRFEHRFGAVFILTGSTGEDAFLTHLLGERLLTAPLLFTREEFLLSQGNSVTTVVLDPIGRVSHIGAEFDAKAVERSVREKVEELKSGMAYAPSELLAAYRGMEKGAVKGGFDTLKSLGEGKGSPEARRLAGLASSWWRPLTYGRLQQIDTLLKGHRVTQAEHVLEALLEDFPGLTRSKDPFAQDIQKILKTIKKPSKELALEYKADRNVCKALEKLKKQGPTKTTLKKLRALVKKHAGTKAAERASAWVARLETASS